MIPSSCGIFAWITSTETRKAVLWTALNSRKIKEKYHQLVFSEVFLTRKGNLLERILFEVCRFLVAALCQFLFQAKMACFNEIHQNVNDLFFKFWRDSYSLAIDS